MSLKKTVAYGFIGLISLSGCKLINPSYYTGPMKNYGVDASSNSNSISDILTMDIEEDTVAERKPGGGAGIGIGDLVGPLAGLALDIANNAISNRQAEYTASYSNSALLTIDKDTYAKLALAAANDATSALPMKDQKSYMVVLRRYLLLNDSGHNYRDNYVNTGFDPTATPLAAEYFFKVHQFDANGIQLRLARVNLLYSRARYKNANANKDFLSLSLDIKLSTGGGNATPNPGGASGNQANNQANNQGAVQGGNQGVNQGEGQVNNQNNNQGANSNGAAQNQGNNNGGSLGESIVLIPMIRPNAQGLPLNIDRQNTIVGKAFFKGFTLQTDPTTNKITPAYLTMSVTISEANISHVKPSSVANFLKNNGTDLTSVIKALFPSSSGGSSKGNGGAGSN